MKWKTTQPIKRNGFESASWTEVDGLRACYAEWSKSEREKFHILMHIYVIREKWYWWAYLQGRKRDVENEHMDTVGEGESEMNWNGSMDIYTLPCVEQTVSGSLLANTDQPSSLWWPGGLRSWDGGEAQEGADTCVLVADLPHCMAETNATS